MNQNLPPPEYPPHVSYPDSERQYPPPGPAAQRVPVSLPAARPVITYIWMALSILVFLGQQASRTTFGGDLPAALGMKVNDLILQGEYWRLFTPVILHGSVLHLGFNMYALYIFGPGLERHYGHGRFLALYLLAGFAGNVLSFIFSSANSLGSSTAIFGLLGAEAVFLFRNQRLLGGSARRALNNLILIAVVNFLIGLSPGIDNWGHLGGLLGGTFFAWLGGPVLEVAGVYPDFRVEDTRPRRQVVLAGVLDFLVFAALAGIAIYLRSG